MHPSSYLRTCISPHQLTRPSSSHGPSCTLQPRFILHPSPTALSIYPSITHPPIHLSSHPLTHLPTHPCMHSPKHPKPTHPSTHSSIVHPPYADLSTYHPTIHPPFHKSIHSSIHPLIHLGPIRSFTSSIYSIHSMYPFCSPPTPSFFFTPVGRTQSHPENSVMRHPPEESTGCLSRWESAGLGEGEVPLGSRFPEKAMIYKQGLKARQDTKQQERRVHTRDQTD